MNGHSRTQHLANKECSPASGLTVGTLNTKLKPRHWQETICKYSHLGAFSAYRSLFKSQDKKDSPWIRKGWNSHHGNSGTQYLLGEKSNFQKGKSNLTSPTAAGISSPGSQKCSIPFSKTTSQGYDWLPGNWSLCTSYTPGTHTNLGYVRIFPMLADFVLCPIYFLSHVESWKSSSFHLSAE